MKLVFLGDSITEGIGASSQDKRYVVLVGKALGCKTVYFSMPWTTV